MFLVEVGFSQVLDKRMKKLFSLIFIGILTACGDSEEPMAFDSGYDYYPTSSGAERIYDVEEINFDLFGPDTSRYFLREYISDSILSDQVSITYVLKREKRTSELEEWESDSLWSVRKTESYVIVTENNLPLVKLSFPVSEGRTWDGNAFNSLQEEGYRYETVSQESVDSLFTSNEVIRVVISDVEKNLVSQDQRSEVYAKGIGLVEKNYIAINFCTVDCDSVGQVQSGRILNQVLVEYVEN